MPERTFRNRHVEVDRLVYALQTAAAFRTGLLPDVLEDTYSWKAVPLWPYATLAAVMTLRAVADGQDLDSICAEVARTVRPLQA